MVDPFAKQTERLLPPEAGEEQKANGCKTGGMVPVEVTRTTHRATNAADFVETKPAFAWHAI